MSNRAEPRQSNESWADYEDRLRAQEISQATVKPRAPKEAWSDYQDRLKAQAGSQVSITPRASEEAWSDYQDRLQAQQTSQAPVPPRAPNESWSDFQDRLRAQSTSKPSAPSRASREKPTKKTVTIESVPAQSTHSTAEQDTRPGDLKPGSLGHPTSVAIPASQSTPALRVRMIAERLARAGGPTKPIKLVRDIRGDSLQGVADAGQDLVLVTEDLVRRLDDNELAYVLGHELAHFEHEDSARMTGYVRKVVEDLGTNAEALDERLKKKGRGFVVRTLAQIGHGAAGIAAGYVMVHSKSREHEQGADTRAVDLMTAAGFDPQAATRALRKLHGGSVPDVGILRTLRSTHPNPASRVAAVARQAEAAKKRNRKQG